MQKILQFDLHRSSKRGFIFCICFSFLVRKVKFNSEMVNKIYYIYHHVSLRIVSALLEYLKSNFSLFSSISQPCLVAFGFWLLLNHAIHT